MNFAYPFIFWLVLAITLLGGTFFWWQKRQKKMYALKIPFLSDLKKAEKNLENFHLQECLNIYNGSFLH